MVTASDKKDQNQKLTALMQAAQGGDAKFYRLFLKEISLVLRRFLARRVPHDDIEDIVQDILLSLHKARHTYDGKRPVLPWVLAIARFRLADYLRQHYASMQHVKVELEEVENLLVDVTEPQDMHESINAIVDGLPDRQRNILTMMHVEGYTAKEIGAQSGMSESAVKVAAHRAYKAIRKRLGRP